MLTVEQVADYFLLQVDEDAGDVMTNLRLQKLVYYAQAWHLAIAEKPLFQDDVEAWVHGPVVPFLYYAYRDYGWQPIPRPDRDAVAMDDQTRELLDEVWDTYGQFSAKALENLTHSEDPWRDARSGYEPGALCREVISQAAMRLYYARSRRASDSTGDDKGEHEDHVNMVRPGFVTRTMFGLQSGTATAENDTAAENRRAAPS